MRHHWIQIGGLIWLALGQAQAVAVETNAVRRVSVEEFAKLAESRTNVVLDVRTEKEFAAGHIPGATNLDFNSANFEKKLAGLDKAKSFLVHCASGRRSARASETMTRLGFKSVVELPAGFRGWEQAGLPVEK